MLLTWRSSARIFSWIWQYSKYESSKILSTPFHVVGNCGDFCHFFFVFWKFGLKILVFALNVLQVCILYIFSSFMCIILFYGTSPIPKNEASLIAWPIVPLGDNGFLQGLFQSITDFLTTISHFNHVLNHWFAFGHTMTSQKWHQTSDVISFWVYVKICFTLKLNFKLFNSSFILYHAFTFTNKTYLRLGKVMKSLSYTLHLGIYSRHGMVICGGSY
jgi:hypothetical protein